MIIQNGNISFKHKTGGGLDNDGYPVAPSITWSDPIPCQYVPKTLNLQSTEGGNAYIKQGYSVYVNFDPNLILTEQLRLTTLKGAKIGEFSVISVEDLRAVGQTVITI